MTRKKPSAKPPKTPKPEPKPEDKTEEAAPPPLVAKKLNRIRFMDNIEGDGSHMILDYVDGKLSEDDEFCGEHSCYRKDIPHGKLRWRYLSSEAIMISCDSCRAVISFPQELLSELPEPEILIDDPVTGHAALMIVHLCVKCGKDLPPKNPSDMPNLCDKCSGRSKSSGNGNGQGVN